MQGLLDFGSLVAFFVAYRVWGLYTATAVLMVAVGILLAVDYLRLMGIVMLAWMWARMAKLSVGKDTSFARDKLMCARYWMERMVPECSLLLERIQAGSETIMAFE